MKTIAVNAPRRLGSRRQARVLLDAQPADLRGVIVVIDLSRTDVATPSFLDEFIKAVLQERGAEHLVVKTGSIRLRDLMQRSARRRGLADRVQFDSSLQ